MFGNDYDTPDGTPIRDYIHVVDLAKGHVKAMSKAGDLQGYNVFNLGSGKGSSVLDVIEAFKKASGQDVPYVIQGRRPGDAVLAVAIPTKANTVLGWKTELSVEDMCRDAWTWASKNPNGYE